MARTTNTQGHDPAIRRGLDSLIPEALFEDGNWGLLLLETGEPAESPKQRSISGARRRWLLVAALVAASLTIAISSLAAVNQWPFDGNGPAAITPTFIVTSGGVGGSSWNLAAYQSQKVGLCLAVTIPTGETLSGGCGEGVRGEAVTPESFDKAPNQSIGVSMSWLPGTSDRLLFGAIAGGVDAVDIEFTDGQVVRAAIVKAPAGLDTDLSIYTARYQASQQPQEVRALSADGTTLQAITIPPPPTEK